jgi:hypothetical protein
MNLGKTRCGKRVSSRVAHRARDLTHDRIRRSRLFVTPVYKTTRLRLVIP